MTFESRNTFKQDGEHGVPMKKRLSGLPQRFHTTCQDNPGYDFPDNDFEKAAGLGKMDMNNQSFGLPICCVLIMLLLAGMGCTPDPPQQIAPKSTVTQTETPKTIMLTMGSWRTDDVVQMNRILNKFHEKCPHIRIKYETTISDVVAYNAALKAQLKAGSGPDIFYLTSYSLGRDFYEQGYLEHLDNLPGLKENFSSTVREAWATDDGIPYGVPFIASSHGIYYNRDIFAKLDLKVPDTWQELLTLARKIRDAGYIPFANASANDWDIAESVFMNVVPNFIGGREGRMAYLKGKRCFNDAHVVAAFQAVKDLVPFFPKNHEMFTYYDSQQLFLQGQAVMWMQGSWDIPFFEASAPPFEWRVFAPPHPAGQPAYITFHMDAGIGLNAASPYKKEAALFLEWMTTTEFGMLFANELPGLFPIHINIKTIENEHANDFLKLNQGRGTDVRFPWENLNDGIPDGYTLMLENAMAVVKNQKTPQEAADALQAGLAQWFEPAKNCDR